jgi:small subunit ribosomal protein S6
MTLPAPTYDLMLLIDQQAEDDTRAKIVADARAAIEAQGELLRHDDWGDRPLTYPIERKPGAEYHLMQFHAGSAELLAELNRSLRITDGLLRFRIIKLKPGVPDAPDMRSPAATARASEPTAEAERAPESEPGVEVEPTTEAEPTAEAEPSFPPETDVAVGDPA